MSTILSILKKPTVVIILGLVAIGVTYAAVQEEESGIETETVSATDIREIVSGTGRISARDEVELSFEISGTVSEVLVEEGERVEAGQVLARLDSDLATSDVAEARSRLQAQEAILEELRAGVTQETIRSAEAKVRSAEITLENVREQQNEAVADAREKLLTTDLEPYLDGDGRENDFSYDPPTISGTYTGDKEGQYRITLYRSSTPSGYSFRFTSDIDQNWSGTVSTQVPQPLGTRGLYITFPEDFAQNFDMAWVLDIPNTRSSRYTTLRQTYEQAVEERDRAIRNTEAALEQAQAEYEVATAGTRDEKLRAQEAAVAQADASLRAAQSRMAKTTLRAPFAGTVKTTSITRGQTVSPSTPTLSLSSGGEFFVTLFVPEVDVSNLETGDRATVSLDAFPNNTYEAEVTFVSPSAVDRNGVASFKTELAFEEPNPQMRLGMTAEVDIITIERNGVIAVPGRAVVREDERNFVRVMENGELERREVELGLRGIDGRVEIVSGLEGGEEVITFAREEDIAALEQ